MKDLSIWISSGGGFPINLMLVIGLRTEYSLLPNEIVGHPNSTCSISWIEAHRHIQTSSPLLPSYTALPSFWLIRQHMCWIFVFLHLGNTLISHTTRIYLFYHLIASALRRLIMMHKHRSLYEFGSRTFLTSTSNLFTGLFWWSRPIHSDGLKVHLRAGVLLNILIAIVSEVGKMVFSIKCATTHHVSEDFLSFLCVWVRLDEIK